MELGTDNISRGGYRGGGRRTSLRNPVDEEIVPNHGWTEESATYWLLIDLPGFKKDEVKLEVDDSGYIIVRGERLITNEQKRLHFEQIFELPNDSDMNNIAGHFDSEILYVHVPKLITSSHDNNNANEITEEATKDGNVEERVDSGETENHNKEHIDDEWRGQSQQNNREREEKEEIRKSESESEFVDAFSEEVIRKWEKESSYDMFRSGGAMEVLMRNKGFVITAVIAFSFGLYVSHKFHSLAAQ